MRLLLLLMVIIALVLASLSLLPLGHPPDADSLVLFQNGATVRVSVADTVEKQNTGLSLVPSLAEGEGMLFVFPNPKIASFWMRDMMFPLDLIWIDEEFQVVQISEDLQPCSSDSCQIYRSNELIQYVLEVNAGFIDENSIRVGDHVELKL
ncbi:MAG: DUF192 domain-containing protein [Candidatus Altiarchaeota archaeon]|nr:DUF192 domain-containing protein [Candidatus Altiarchaeota archaeon]